MAESKRQGVGFLFPISMIAALCATIPLVFLYGFSVMPNVSGPKFHFRFALSIISVICLILGMFMLKIGRRFGPFISVLGAALSIIITFPLIERIIKVGSGNNDAGEALWIPIAILGLLSGHITVALSRVFKFRKTEVTPWPQ